MCGDNVRDNATFSPDSARMFAHATKGGLTLPRNGMQGLKVALSCEEEDTCMHCLTLPLNEKQGSALADAYASAPETRRRGQVSASYTAKRSFFFVVFWWHKKRGPS